MSLASSSVQSTSRWGVSNGGFRRFAIRGFSACKPADGRVATAVAIALVCLATPAGGQELKLVESEKTIVIRHAGKPVVTYNKVSPPAPNGIDRIYERSGCLHPVASPTGRTVTEMFPVDHPHQQGVFSAWVKTAYDGRPIDFWNSAAETGQVRHERVVSTFETKDDAGFEVDLIHRALRDPPVDVLRERWKIKVSRTNGAFHCFDLETEQTALTSKPLMISKYHYGGIVLRGPTRWLTKEDRQLAKSPDLVLEPSDFLNNLGSSRKKGNHQRAKWVALWGQIEGKPVSIAVLSHADNFRAPQAARLHPTKPYFCFAPCVNGAFTIDKSHPFKGRYRFLITDAMPDAAWLDSQWKAWCGE